ncbi:MAG: choice-of-anchor L domain-containing protein [Candidatus Cyclobacteriaceae bacterium M3_2C_046]
MHILIFILTGLIFFKVALAQIKIDTTYSPEFLVNEILLGKGILAGNIKYTGPDHAFGFFQDSSAQVNIKKGLLLTSGNVFYVKGPNNSDFKGWASGSAGDADLDQLTPGRTFDAAVLEFDFVTASEHLEFRYIFGSEEYLEYVGSQYNDVFAFFISGPGIDKQNIAQIPGKNIPIAINNVNHKKHKKFFNDNSYFNQVDRYIWDFRKKKVIENKNYHRIPPEIAFYTQYDGFTKVLTASCQVIPNQVYHIKIAIADVADAILDSGVFLEAGSFQSKGDTLMALQNPFKYQGSIQKSMIKPIEPQAAKPNVLNEIIVKSNEPEATDILHYIYFDFDHSQPRAEAKSTVSEIVKYYENNPGSFIEVIGHTDSIGSMDYNFALSQKRSSTIYQYLLDQGISSELIQTAYWGELKPVEDNETDEGRARNRRVEILIRTNLAQLP